MSLPLTVIVTGIIKGTITVVVACIIVVVVVVVGSNGVNVVIESDIQVGCSSAGI